jgi:hypothetical protein
MDKNIYSTSIMFDIINSKSIDLIILYLIWRILVAFHNGLIGWVWNLELWFSTFAEDCNAS